MQKLSRDQHIFRHIKMTWIDGDFIEPAAFRLAVRDGQMESGLSVNWVEYYQKPTPKEAVAPLRDVLKSKGRSVGGESKFALLNVGAVEDAAARYASVSVDTDEDPQDPSHALVTGQAAFNDQVAEELAKVVIATFPAKSG